MLRVSSRLDDSLEGLVHRVIGCCLEVHRALGPGLLEGIYRRATCVELKASNIPFDEEKRIPILYRGELLTDQRLDILVAGEIIVEVKAVDHLAPVHHAQVISYLRASGLRVALLVNFNVPTLPQGLRRIVL